MMRYTFKHKGETIAVNLELLSGCSDSYFRIDWDRCPFCEVPLKSPQKDARASTVFDRIWRMDAPNSGGAAHFETCCCRTILVMRHMAAELCGNTWSGLTCRLYKRHNDSCEAVSYSGQIQKWDRQLVKLQMVTYDDPEQARRDPLLALRELRECLEAEYRAKQRKLDDLIVVNIAEAQKLANTTAEAVKAAADAKDRYEAVLKTRKLRVVIKEPRKERDGIGEPRVYEFDAPGGVRYLEVFRTTHAKEGIVFPMRTIRRLTLPPGAEFEVFELVADEVEQ